MQKWVCTKCGEKEIPQDIEYCEECTEKSFKKIGGWLYLPAISLILSIINTLFLLGKTVNTMPQFYSALPDHWQFFIIFEITSNALLLLLTISTVIFFFRKSKKAPRLCVLFYLSNTIIKGITVFLIANILSIPISYNNILPTLQAIVTTAIWVPYFMVSVRVKRTFVN
ncbi:hypothetical protein TI10_03845 [Photorhabdus luminescens subsp. luminescens]|uniref:DUF2569 domain-containing protein n=1 Tax=Photorhabdus luminescens TaxID=29488 RepID=A0A1G5R2D7_PHOLU|nr:DUF2569 domain-containing protein [Photorhabdus luminescens]KMW74887.1 hypothetical protein TI10_03845 [Photorhabdus luminescens subsp. luminescens]SCZ68233.1 Protein of unknown function [Photorhabdus luminescens]